MLGHFLQSEHKPCEGLEKCKQINQRWENVCPSVFVLKKFEQVTTVVMRAGLLLGLGEWVVGAVSSQSARRNIRVDGDLGAIGVQCALFSRLKHNDFLLILT